ncbi:hypothetical protein [Mycobacterium timonense]|jgi:hypothetical protein|uniref:Uncharacterized protein n=1 Tax=Mycobacterium timonense TaxID=701043 RepID=A0A7I9Z038_9MYCO|nr:hypothetical protein [Mycobacterium timonense]GFG94334.1 hypothetical protein MTIM_02130 [Mycobacterium timonense]
MSTDPCLVDDPWLVQALQEGTEVGSVELDVPGGINRWWADVPKLGWRIQSIEVFTAATGRGIGRES